MGSAALLAPQIAPASIVLAGFHDFTGPFYVVPGGSGNNFAYSGFSAWVVPSSNVYATGGSLDGIYGSQDPTGDMNWVWEENNLAYKGHANGVNDGSAAANSTHPLVFAVYNYGGPSGKNMLEALLFDAIKPKTPDTAGVTVEYSYDLNPTYTLLKHVSFDTPYYASGGESTLAYDAADFSLEFSHLLRHDLFLDVGHTILFKFTPDEASGTILFDNLALTAIPEPGSLVALGCLVGSGAFLRRRRRR